MKVELSKDPLFNKKQSPLKQFKERQLQRQKNLRIMRMNPMLQNKQINIQVTDPLFQQLKVYKDETTIKKTFQVSHASHNLRKYIYEQQKNLKCLRLDRIKEGQSGNLHQSQEVIDIGQQDKMSNQFNSKLELSFQSNKNNIEPNKYINQSNRSNNSLLQKSGARNAGIKFDFLIKQIEKQENNKDTKPIDIPRIEQIFKSQQKQFVLYESRLMKSTLANAITSIGKRVHKIQKKRYKGMNSSDTSIDSPRTTQNQLFPPISSLNVIQNEEDMELDVRIQKKLKKGQRLCDRLYKEKKQMQNHQGNNGKQSQQSLNFFHHIPKKAKKKVMLEGIKSVSFQDGNRQLKITPASTLLFELNRLGKGKLKKEKQLSGLINNSFKNRQDILEEKSIFYEKQTLFNDLSPSNQFRLRKQMDRRLIHRLDLSREQINNFINYLYQIKDYHVILGEEILTLLKRVREQLLSGKVMKIADFNQIVKGIEGQYCKQDQNGILKSYPNQLIISKLYDMMI